MPPTTVIAVVCLTNCMHELQVAAASPDLFQAMAVEVGPIAELPPPPLHPDLLPLQVGCGYQAPLNLQL